MHLDRLTSGEKLAGVSAVALFAAMFLDWFVVKIPDSTGVNFFLDGTGQDAWEALGYIPIILSIVIVFVLAAVVSRLLGADYELPVPANGVVAILGVVAVLLILFRIIDPPSFGSFEGFFGRTVAAERTVEYGIFIGLLAAIGIGLGGYGAMREKGNSSSLIAHREQASPHPQED